MRQIDLNRANEQAGQMRRQSDDLRDARALLLSFQRELQQHWHGQEMVGINNAINNMLSKISSTSTEMDTIAAEIVSTAQEVRRQEDLADARMVLAREDNNVENLRRIFDNIQHHHNINQTHHTQAELNTAVTNLNNAIRRRNDAAARVRALMR